MHKHKGIVGDWKNYFNEKACNLIWEKEGWTLWTSGYEENKGWIDKFLEFKSKN
jgi:hypothetical protein